MDITEIINAVACGLLSLACFLAILSRRVRDGLSMRPGLAMMALAFGGLAGRIAGGLHAGELRSLQNLLLLLHAGVAWCAVGYLFRRRKSGHEMRRSTDWGDLEDAQRSGGDL
jgi:hypothetical protein